MRRVNVACDHCGLAIETEDELARQVSLDHMTDEWEIEGTSDQVGDLCHLCVALLKQWLKPTAITADLAEQEIEDEL
jgi:hypothetical protein